MGGLYGRILWEIRENASRLFNDINGLQWCRRRDLNPRPTHYEDLSRSHEH